MKKILLLAILIPIFLFGANEEFHQHWGLGFDLAYFLPPRNSGILSFGSEIAIRTFTDHLFVNLGVRYTDFDSLAISGHDFIDSPFGLTNSITLYSGLLVKFAGGGSSIILTFGYGMAFLINPQLNNTLLENDLMKHYKWDFCQANVSRDFSVPHGFVTGFGFGSHEEYSNASEDLIWFRINLVWMFGDVDIYGDVYYSKDNSPITRIDFPTGKYKLDLRGIYICLGFYVFN